SDYELPFEIREYENLTKLNNIFIELEDNNLIEHINELNNLQSYETDDRAIALINLSNELENTSIVDYATEYTQDIIDDDLLKILCENNDPYRLKFLLQNMNPNREYHFINGYGNIEELTSDRLDAIQSDLLDLLYSNIG